MAFFQPVAEAPGPNVTVNVQIDDFGTQVQIESVRRYIELIRPVRHRSEAGQGPRHLESPRDEFQVHVRKRESNKRAAASLGETSFL
jgi:hypothetical protein